MSEMTTLEMFREAQPNWIVGAVCPFHTVMLDTDMSEPYVLMVSSLEW